MRGAAGRGDAITQTSATSVLASRKQSYFIRRQISRILHGRRPSERVVRAFRARFRGDWIAVPINHPVGGNERGRYGTKEIKRRGKRNEIQIFPRVVREQAAARGLERAFLRAPSGAPAGGGVPLDERSEEERERGEPGRNCKIALALCSSWGVPPRRKRYARARARACSNVRGRFI